VVAVGAKRAHRGLAVPACAERAPRVSWVVAIAVFVTFLALCMVRVPSSGFVPAAGAVGDPVVVDRFESVAWAHLAADPGAQPGGVGPRADPSRQPPCVGGDPGRVEPWSPFSSGAVFAHPS
jgi:hypothetical protein